MAPGRSVCVREGGVGVGGPWLLTGGWTVGVPRIAEQSIGAPDGVFRHPRNQAPCNCTTACGACMQPCACVQGAVARIPPPPSTPHTQTDRKKGGGMSKLPAGVSPTSRGKQGPCVALLDMRICPPTTEATPKSRPRRVSGFPPTLAHPATPSPPGLLRANSTPPPAYRFRTQGTLQGRCSGRLSGPSQRGLPCQPQAKGGSVGEGWG